MVRLLALAIPVGASAAASAAVSRALPRPSGALREAGWWLMILAASMLVLAAVDR